MKILLVCEDETVSSCVQNALCETGECDVITYRYLLKALDNVEEIDSDAIIINAVDYPRHWKTLVAYMKCIGCLSIPVLYTGENYDEEEAQKARTLGVPLTFCSIEDKDALKQIVDKILNMAKAARAKDSECAASSNVSSSYTPQDALMFTHPHNKAFVIGKVLSVKDNEVMFAPDFPMLARSIAKGDKIDEVSYKHGGIMHFLKGHIESTESGGEVLNIRLENA